MQLRIHGGIRRIPLTLCLALVLFFASCCHSQPTNHPDSQPHFRSRKSGSLLKSTHLTGRHRSHRQEHKSEATPKLGPGSSPDPCTTLSTKWSSQLAVRPSEVVACFQVFPWNKTESDSVIDTVWKTLVELYPYTDIVLNSPEPNLPIRVNLRRSLKRLLRKNFSSEFEFHSQLYHLVQSLQDGHTAWDPRCYTAAITLTAFPLVKVWDPVSESTKVKISPLVDLESLESNPSLGNVFQQTEYIIGGSISDFAGAHITHANGIPILDYVESMAALAGDYRDQQSRINTLFFRPAFNPGEYFPGSFMRLPFLPDSDGITYTLIRVGETAPETLHVPYLVFYRGQSFINSAQYYALNCKADPLQLPPPAQPQGQVGSAGVRVHRHLPKEKPSLRHTKFRPFVPDGDSQFSSLTEDTDGIKVYMLGDNMTAVMTIPDFLGIQSRNESVSSQDAVVSYLEELLVAYQTVRLSGASRLIIDISNNGGGFVVTGSFLTNILFPEGGDPQFPMRLRASHLALAAYRVASFNLTSQSSSDYDFSIWSSPETRAPFRNGSEFFLPVTDLPSNGYHTHFSSPFIGQSYYKLVQEYDPLLVPSTNLFSPENILVVSNGLCFSTCGVFTYELRQRYGVRVVAVGGRDGSAPFAFAAGTVGFVIPDFEVFYATEVHYLGLTKDRYAPKPLPVKGSLRWTTAAAYGHRSATVPQEFIYEPAQIKLPFTDETVLSLPTLWTQVSKLFCGSR